MSPLHAFRRLAGMSLREVYTRGRQEAGRRRDVLLAHAHLDPFHAPRTGLDGRGRFFRDAADTPRILEILERRAPGYAARVVAAADRILEGRFDLLGYTGLDFGREIDWQLDPVSGRRAPDAPWPTIPFLDYAAVGDHKVTWELSRCQFLETLAKAHRISGDPRYAAAVERYWRDWLRRNPYPMGINWASVLEVAFRALSWMWTAFLLEGAPAATTAFEHDMAREIARSAWHIERFLSTYFSPNTHLLGEGVALLAIGLRYPDLPGAARWRETGWRITLEEARRQVRGDGLHFEQSAYYHVYATDFFLHARLLAERNGLTAAELDPTLRRMLSALAGLSRAGALSRFGDDDGGRLFDGSRNRPEQMLDPLSTGAVLFRDPELRAAASELCEETLWLLGPESEAVYDALDSVEPTRHSPVFRESGIYTMTARDRAGRRLQLFIDAGEQGALSAGHGHADALSIQLAADGRMWLADRGSGAYMGADGLRNLLRGTAAHSTATVDGLDQADPKGPFSWGPLPEVGLRRWVSTDALDFFEGQHTGYRRLSPPVTHHRFVVGLRSGLWFVRDVLEGSGFHTIDIHWQFAPETKVSPEGAAALTRRGEEALAIVPAAEEDWKASAARLPYSPAYGSCVESPVVRWTRRGALPVEFAAAIGFTETLQPGALRRLGSANEAVYELEANGERHRFCFGASAGEGAVFTYRTSAHETEIVIRPDGSWIERRAGSC